MGGDVQGLRLRYIHMGAKYKSYLSIIHSRIFIRNALNNTIILLYILYNKNSYDKSGIHKVQRDATKW